MAERLPRHKRLYKDSPKLERDGDGHMAVTKNDKRGEHESEGGKESTEMESGVDGMAVHERHAVERTQLKHKHMKEHMDVHTHNELEHMSHKGDKSELHARHHEKLKNLHKEHEAEHKAMYGRHEKEIHGGESKEMTIDGKNEGHETAKDKAASEPKKEKKE